jgi:hypothetical protein
MEPQAMDFNLSGQDGPGLGLIDIQLTPPSDIASPHYVENAHTLSRQEAANHPPFLNRGVTFLADMANLTIN